MRGEPPEATYVFKHALVQDAAYASLLRARRQQIHARIAQVLPEKFPDLTARQPETLAHHCEAAGLEAASQGVLEPRWPAGAGQRDLRRGNQSSRAGHWRWSQRRAPSEARMREEAGLLLDRGMAMVALKGPASAEHGQMADGSPQGQRAIRRRCAAFPCPLGRLDVPLRGRQPAGSHRARRHAGGDGQSDRRRRSAAAGPPCALDDGVRCAARSRSRVTLSSTGWRCTISDDIAIIGRCTAPTTRACAPTAPVRCTLWQAGLAERAAEVAQEAVRLGNEVGHPFSRRRCPLVRRLPRHHGRR